MPNYDKEKEKEEPTLRELLGHRVDPHAYHSHYQGKVEVKEEDIETHVAYIYEKIDIFGNKHIIDGRTNSTKDGLFLYNDHIVSERIIKEIVAKDKSRHITISRKRRNSEGELEDDSHTFYERVPNAYKEITRKYKAK